MGKQEKNLQKQFDDMAERCAKKLKDLLHAAGYSEPTQEQLDWFNDDRNHCSAADMIPRINPPTQSKNVMDNPAEPLIIEGRPFTPDDLQHLDELEKELQKDTPPMTQMELKSYWGLGLLPQSAQELAHARFFRLPIIIDTPTSEKTEE